jgi:hypothetical protein
MGIASTTGPRWSVVVCPDVAPVVVELKELAVLQLLVKPLSLPFAFRLLLQMIMFENYDH